jgi:polysaccharide export outer membrane protein
LDARYGQLFGGIEVTPILLDRAPRYIYVVGEVAQPGRFDLQGPTSLMQAIALAGGWNAESANLRQVVVFRRGEDWRLMATMLNIRGGLYGRQPLPKDELWLRDSDIVLVPKSRLRVLDDVIELVFTDGLYAAIPQLIFRDLIFGRFDNVTPL